MREVLNGKTTSFLFCVREEKGEGKRVRGGGREKGKGKKEETSKSKSSELGAGEALKGGVWGLTGSLPSSLTSTPSPLFPNQEREREMRGGKRENESVERDKRTGQSVKK